jgi:hypothetical protein
MPANAIVLDANLLVLLIVGAASRSYIARHKRLRAYAARDFALLTDMLSAAPRIILTPNTVTEASNLSGQIAEPARSHIFAVFRALLPTADEIYVESTKAANHMAFTRLGVADAALLSIMAENRTLVTADLDLYLEAARHGYAAINFNHLIEANR